MKRNVLAILALLQCLFLRAQILGLHSSDYETGVPIDTTCYTISYDFAYVNWPERKPYKPIHEQMLLLIGNHSASFFSSVVEKSDSMIAETIHKGSGEIMVAGRITWRTYTNYPAKGQYSYLERLTDDRFEMREQMPIPVWSLCEDSITNILGYPCRKATTTFLGREWTAWYAEDVPLDNGPWLLSGLPGLILQAETADSCFSFSANGLMKNISTRPIYYKGEKYERLSRKALSDVYRRYYADPVGWATDNSKMKLILVDDKGNTVTTRKRSPYNLIDLTLQRGD